MKKYFAYSTILDKTAFQEWKDQHGYSSFALPEGKLAKALNIKLVYDFASRWWGGRVAGLAEAPGEQIYGIFFEVNEQDWGIIQHKEGVVTGMCVEIPVKVEVDGEMVDAIAFTTNPERAQNFGPKSERFLQALIKGGRSAGLPSDYLKKVETDFNSDN